jgi:hypothetical protein
MRRTVLILLALVVSLFVAGEGSAASRGRRGKAKQAKASSRKVREAPPKAEADPVAEKKGELVAANADAPKQRGPTRIDVDDRLIQGQGNTAGSVYLYDRKELALDPMVKKRSSFLPELMGSVYGESNGRPRF